MHKLIAGYLALLIALVVFQFSSLFHLQPELERESVVVARALDGDTLELKDGRIIRLLNINAPEKDTLTAKYATEIIKTFENKTLSIEKQGIDKYHRTLARIYTPGYLNQYLVAEGFASKFLVDEKELQVYAEAEEQAIQKEKGMWRISPWSNCIEVSLDKKVELVSLIVHCPDLSLKGWQIKDESRKIYEFKINKVERVRLHTELGTDNKTDLFWNSKTAIWNNDRDTLYLFDSEGRLVAHKVYGY